MYHFIAVCMHFFIILKYVTAKGSIFSFSHVPYVTDHYHIWQFKRLPVKTIVPTYSIWFKN